MIYQFKPCPGEPLGASLPYGFRLRVITGTRKGDRVQVKDLQGNPLGFVSLRSLEALR